MNTNNRLSAMERYLGSEFVKEHVSLTEDLWYLLNDQHSEEFSITDMCMILFMNCGSTGPSRSMNEDSSHCMAKIVGHSILLQLPEKHKGLWIGIGGKYIKKAVAILQKIGYSLRVI